MKRKNLSKTFNISLLVFVLLIALLSFFYLGKDENKQATSVTSATINVDTDQKIESIPQTDTTQTAETKMEIPDMPILMYHYIRALDDPNDKIGTNLSVSPEAFAKQLDLIVEKGYTTMTFEDIKAGNIPAKPVMLTFDDGYADFYASAYPEIKKRKMRAVSYPIYNKIGSGSYMNEAQLKEISQNNIEIGSHTLSHPDLTKISADKVSTELTQSKEKLEAILGAKVISFCYPSGKVNAEVKSITKNVGYAYAVTTNSKLTTFSDLLILNRFRVNHDTSISAYIK